MDLSVDPAQFYLKLGQTYQQQQRLQRALFHYDQALRTEPQLAEVYFNRSFIYAKQGHIEMALADLVTALQYRPVPEYYSVLLFSLMYQPLLPWNQAYGYFKQWDAQVAASLPVYDGYTNLPEPERRLKIGYLSADFRHHVVIHLFAALLAYRNATDFEVFLYANQPVEDGVTAWFKEKCDHWRLVIDLSDHQLCEVIRADQIDILVDLSGHTAGNRLYALACQPAPIQISGPGYLGTTGLKTIHWRFTDPYMQPLDAETYLSEKLIYLDSIMHFIPQQAPYAQLPLYPPPCLSKGFAVLGCSNNPVKLNTYTATLWAQILQQSPTTYLAFKYQGFDEPSVQQRWRDFFAQWGIGPERLRFDGHTGQMAHLDFYRQIDVLLDPFPYSGGVSTLEALWAGVPVVTLAGQQWFGCRTSESILSNLGCQHWVVATPADYVAQVVALLAEPEALVYWRKHLRTALHASILCDSTGFTRQVENAYRLIWGEWCDINAP